MARWLPLLLVGASACYTAPTPACGFVCGDGNSCPDSYTCNTTDRICHLDGTNETCDPAPEGPGLPITSTVTPDDGATNVPTNATVMIELSVSYDPAGATIDDSRLVVTAADSQPIPGFVMPGAYDAQIIFLPNHLPNASLVTAQLQPGLKTVDGHTIGGRVWTFMTENDVTSPTMTGGVPMDGSSDVPLFGEGIRLTFDEDVQNVEAGAISVTTSAGPVAGSWFYDPTAPYHLATFRADFGLPASSVVTVRSQATLVDYAGNPVHPFTVTFTTTTDTTPPIVFAHLPADNDTNIPTNTTIIVQLTEPVTNIDTTTFRVDNAGTPITGTITANGADYTFTPDALLPAATTITVTLAGSIADASGNQLGAPVTFEFTTEP